MSENSKPNGAVEAVAEVAEEVEEIQDPEAVSQAISLRVTVGMVERYKAAAQLHGVNGYQTLMKHVLRSWLDDNMPIDAPRVTTPAETPRPVRSHKELLAALREAVKQQEEAVARGAAKDELQALQEAIDGIRDDLADLENSGDV